MTDDRTERRRLRDLIRKGALEGLRGHPVENWYEFSGIGEVRRLEAEYLPAEAVQAKYRVGEGYRP